MTRKSNAGRKHKPIDQQLFENLCHIWCTRQEIESILDVTEPTLNDWCRRIYGTTFKEASKRFSDGGKASLRRNQLHLSKKNAAMGIWLGKQKLGQKENPEVMQQFNGHLSKVLDYLHEIKDDEDFMTIAKNVQYAHPCEEEQQNESSEQKDEKGWSDPRCFR